MPSKEKDIFISTRIISNYQHVGVYPVFEITEQGNVQSFPF